MYLYCLSCSSFKWYFIIWVGLSTDTHQRFHKYVALLAWKKPNSDGIKIRLATIFYFSNFWKQNSNRMKIDLWKKSLWNPCSRAKRMFLSFRVLTWRFSRELMFEIVPPARRVFSSGLSWGSRSNTSVWNTMSMRVKKICGRRNTAKERPNAPPSTGNLHEFRHVRRICLPWARLDYRVLFVKFSNAFLIAMS